MPQHCHTVGGPYKLTRPSQASDASSRHKKMSTATTTVRRTQRGACALSFRQIRQKRGTCCGTLVDLMITQGVYTIEEIKEFANSLLFVAACRIARVGDAEVQLTHDEFLAVGTGLWGWVLV